MNTTEARLRLSLFRRPDRSTLARLVLASDRWYRRGVRTLLCRPPQWSCVRVGLQSGFVEVYLGVRCVVTCPRPCRGAEHLHPISSGSLVTALSPVPNTYPGYPQDIRCPSTLSCSVWPSRSCSVACISARMRLSTRSFPVGTALELDVVGAKFSCGNGIASYSGRHLSRDVVRDPSDHQRGAWT
jgi:hypothetical protein